ncbi:hypothetical protein [Desulfofustis limnaeus]|uniref:IS1595 family transposase n=1 Tax=Desulfofustis limnaeus TaxID=2740163 RepID=A0ABM7W6K6_9BACT|nr:hypothetical protein [Desulfofustis limnaeus]BDD86582.1 IS1595 family transposase [Desulfofustis limnaeus]
MNEAMPLPHHDDQAATLLRDETWCVRYLFQLRWPSDFICPYCGLSGGRRKPQATITCRCCTAPKNRPPRGCGWPGPQEALSAKRLQHQFHINSYQSAWKWLKILRLAMKRTNRKRCAGSIEIDSRFIRFGVAPASGRYLLAAVEVEPKLRFHGRVSMAQHSTLAADVLLGFIERCSEPGSTILTPDRPEFLLNSSPGRLYLQEPRCLRQERANEAIDDCLGSFSNRLGPKMTAARLQEHLDDFCFQSNARLSDRGTRFEQLVKALLLPPPGGLRRRSPEACRAGGQS